MSSRNLNYLLAPRSIALIGASDRPQSIGATVMRNLLTGGFAGPIWPVNKKHSGVADRPAYRTVASLPQPPDLAILCTPAATIPGLVAELGASGGRAAVVLTAGLETQGKDGRSLTAAMLEAAKPHLLRILGPNCLGLLAPRIGLNASFAHTHALPGALAFMLDAAMPSAWSRANPVDIVGDAPAERYAAALDAVLADPGPTPRC
jgi:acetyltransferase